MTCRRPSVAPQTAHVLTLWPDRTSGVESRPPAKLLMGRFGIAEGVIRILLNDEFHAGRKLLADVETACPLSVVPIETVPVWSMARSGRWALLAVWFATPHVLLAVDHSIWSPVSHTLAEILAARSSERHRKSLHKTLLSAGKLFGGLGW